MYQLPVTLKIDIERFGSLSADYREKKIGSVQFKAFRVPMGVYEQRQDEVYMARVRTTGGVIEPAQFLQLIEIARRYGSGLLHITTRQEIQVQNLHLEQIEPLLHELQVTGLSTKGGGGNTIRNILVSEESGLFAGEQFDTTPYAMALTSKLIAESDSYLLPRKMKIAFSSDDRQIGYAAINDLGFVAKIRDGEKGFLVYAGGGGGAKPTVGWVLFDFVPATALYAVAGALKKFFSEHGNRKNKHKARLRFIFYKLGTEETLRLIKEYYWAARETEPLFTLPDTEDERPDYTLHAGSAEGISLSELTGFHQVPRVEEDGDPAGLADFHRVVRIEENSDSAEFTGFHPADDGGFALWKGRYVMLQKQSGYNSILVPFLMGNIRLDDEKTVVGVQKLLRFASRFGKHTVRFTTTQSIRLRNIPNEALPELYRILGEFVEDLHDSVIINNIISCTGADTCRLGIGLSKGLAAAIRRKLRQSGLVLDRVADVRIHISGCPNSCGQQLWADIGFSGKVLRNSRAYPGYQVYLAANRSDAPKFAEPVGSISARDIPEFVCRLLESYTDGASGRYASFTSYLEAEGKTKASGLIEEYKTIPPFSEDKNYYFDWGAETLFSVVGQGAPECSAGLFDMIEVDIALINKSKAALETETDVTVVNSLLYDIIYSSSRMLLVTRGLEPKTTADVFDLFIGNFIGYGIVEERFERIVSAARNDKTYHFIPLKNEIYALADSVMELYNNMDDSLQFKNIKQKDSAAVSSSAGQVAPAAQDRKENAEGGNRKFKDLRGVACPMNFVQTKIQLAAMQSGQELEIWLDDGQPINNVPGSVRNEGHEVVEQSPQENWWKVIIRKK